MKNKVELLNAVEHQIGQVEICLATIQNTSNKFIRESQVLSKLVVQLQSIKEQLINLHERVSELD